VPVTTIDPQDSPIGGIGVGRRERTVQTVGVQTRPAGIAYPVIAVGYAVVAVSVIASLAVGLGIVVAWLAGSGVVFAVALGTTGATGLLGGLLVAPPLFRRIGRR
jgi:uncharacterized membrane protein (DUF441 family)